jgi:hypothetical protein
MWKRFSKNKPKQDGWYICTVEVEKQQRYVMELHWYSEKQKFIDNIRQNVCETYEVIGCSGKRLYDIGQDRTRGVVAWKKQPKPYMKGFVKEI